MPVADVVPHQRRSRPRYVAAEEMDRLLAGVPPVDPERWRHDMGRLGDDRPTSPAEHDA